MLEIQNDRKDYISAKVGHHYTLRRGLGLRSPFFHLHYFLRLRNPYSERLQRVLGL
jgi:hypothetical protein